MPQPARLGRHARCWRPRLTDIAAVMARVHPDRGICFLEEIDDGLAPRAAGSGRVLTAACSTTEVQMETRPRCGQAWRSATPMSPISIDDDGPGLADAQMMEALLPGRAAGQGVHRSWGSGCRSRASWRAPPADTVLLCRGPLGGLRATIRVAAHEQRRTAAPSIEGRVGPVPTCPSGEGRCCGVSGRKPRVGG